MDVKLSDDNMKDIIAKAVLDTLTPESRAEMITAAIKGMLAPPVNPGQYGERRSALQVSFDAAVREVAMNVAREQIVGNTEIKAQIVALIAEAWGKLTNGEAHSNLVDKVTSAISAALTGDRY